MDLKPRTRFLLLSVFPAIVGLFLAAPTEPSRAEPPSGDRSLAAVDAGDGKSRADDAWRYKHYNGRWWYWLPSDRWAVYENDRWRLFKPAADASEDEKQSAAAPAEAAAPESIDPARQAAEYQLAAGNAYNRHAREHARILERYAALGKPVPAEIVEQHADAIRRNVQQAQMAFAQLAEAGKDKPDLLAAIERLQLRLAKAADSIERLKAHAEKHEAAESQAIQSISAEIESLLRESHSAGQQADRQFYDSHSDNYYFSGEGHFVD
ncbi:MAG TPA: hypothetical protein VHB99_15605 [Pirellulales bacterium]|nr:hypothetical protein [Pirellulales bacterium]